MTVPVCMRTCRQLTEHHMWREDDTEHRSCVYMAPGSLTRQPEKDSRGPMTSPNAYNVWPKSRQFEPDAPHAGRDLSVRVTRDFPAFIPADTMLKLKRCSHLPGLIPVLVLDR